MTWRSCYRTYTAWPSVTRRVTAFQTDVPGKGIREIICNKSCQVQEPSVLGLLQDICICTFKKSEFTKEPSPVLHQCCFQNVFVRSSLKSLRDTGRRTISQLALSRFKVSLYESSTTTLVQRAVGWSWQMKPIPSQGFIHPALLQTTGPHGQRAGLHCWCWWHHPHPQSWPHRLCGRVA